ncbi:MFS general substrate transporter [Thelephora ganbajun]|uniref:MFS general substrate transporter n=1 Tax=Thelephora ganbajun TaxID=370292 RepID=A0ACB6ZBA0_THEGA|nr:MFS general substrate transporter [Thelephora ganbajun]
MAPYFLRNLLPQKEKTEQTRPLWEVLASLTWTQWGLFFSGWLAWACDAIDFFSVSLTIGDLKDQFHRPTHDITTSITLTLLFRSIGAIIFGLVSDRYGRKWPLIANLLLISSLSLGCSFVQTFKQFLAIRSLFGVGMGGIWGLASASALENLPVEARGIASGIMQQGYAGGYLIAALVNLYLIPHTTWRNQFRTSAGVSATAAIIRLFFPDSEVFLRARREKQTGVEKSSKSKTRIFFHEIGQMLKNHWQLCIYAVLLMSGFNFLSHGSQDLYPTYLVDSKGFTKFNATVATIIGNCGAIAGSIIAGWLSQYIGRRLTIIVFVLLIGAFIPLWILPSTFGKLAAGAFCVQFGVQGAWGVVPILLSEISPSAFRSTFPGVAYQLGNMVSSASAQIEASVGQHARTTIMTSDGPKDVPNYALIQGIFIGCVSVYVIVLALIGPEKHGSHFERGKTAFQAGASKEDVDSAGENEVHNLNEMHDFDRSSMGSVGAKEKERVIQLVETKRPSRKDSYV